jgi:hypothetical protein
MNEFSSRIDAQRSLLKIVNEKVRKNEELFSLTTKAIERWSSANSIGASSQIVQLLNAASSRIFTMANWSDDPIAGEYILSEQEVSAIGEEIMRMPAC